MVVFTDEISIREKNVNHRRLKNYYKINPSLTPSKQICEYTIHFQRIVFCKF